MCAAAATRGALAFKGVSRVTVSFHALDVMSDEQVGQLAAALAAAGGVAALDTQPLADRSAPPEGMEDLLEEYEEEGDAEAVDKLWRRQDREYREHGRVGHKLAAFVAAIPSLSGLDVTGLAAGLLNEPGDSDHELDWEDVEEARRNPHLQRVRCRRRRLPLPPALRTPRGAPHALAAALQCAASTYARQRPRVIRHPLPCIAPRRRRRRRRRRRQEFKSVWAVLGSLGGLTRLQSLTCIVDQDGLDTLAPSVDGLATCLRRLDVDTRGFSDPFDPEALHFVSRLTSLQALAIRASGVDIGGDVRYLSVLTALGALPQLRSLEIDFPPPDLATLARLSALTELRLVLPRSGRLAAPRGAFAAVSKLACRHVDVARIGELQAAFPAVTDAQICISGSRLPAPGPDAWRLRRLVLEDYLHAPRAGRPPLIPLLQALGCGSGAQSRLEVLSLPPSYADAASLTNDDFASIMQAFPRL